MKLGSPVPHKRSRIEVIPLIDIIFFLLASFMMVSLQMQKMETVRVNLPTSTQARRDFAPDMINVAVRRGGDVYVGKELVSQAELFNMVSNKFSANTNLAVYISGDVDAIHGDMIRVLDNVRNAGVQKVAFAVKPAPPPPK
jgi:biopolymer transport protein ExbD